MNSVHVEYAMEYRFKRKPIADKMERKMRTSRTSEKSTFLTNVHHSICYLHKVKRNKLYTTSIVEYNIIIRIQVNSFFFFFYNIKEPYYCLFRRSSQLSAAVVKMQTVKRNLLIFFIKDSR